ncbi:hypothetical protein OROMI_007975 [Orobanche minor]
MDAQAKKKALFRAKLNAQKQQKQQKQRIDSPIIRFTSPSLWRSTHGPCSVTSATLRRCGKPRG